MTTNCRVKKCKHNEQGNCNLYFRDKRECNIFMYYCDPSSAEEMNIREVAYARFMLGYSRKLRGRAT